MKNLIHCNVILYKTYYLKIHKYYINIYHSKKTTTVVISSTAYPSYCHFSNDFCTISFAHPSVSLL